MSELQAALLAIGTGVIVAVYLFGWWQQRQYRRRFGSAFRSIRADALYQGGQTTGPVPVIPEELEDTPVIQVDAETVTDQQDGPCSLLDVHSDFIIELHLNEPSPASVLGGFWQRKFDFGKPVQVCGMSFTDKRWGRVIAEGNGLYEHLRIALQLVDRSGAVSVARLADFRDLVLGIAQQIKADVTVPDVEEAHRHALELDEFCAGVDKMIGVNLVLPGERQLAGGKIAQAAAVLGMTLEPDGAFHLLDARRHSLFSLTSRDSRPFQHHTLGTFTTQGITLLMDVPHVENPVAQFDVLLKVARELANQLQVNVVDDNLVALNERGLERIRANIEVVEATMRERGIAPGSTQARRLFS